MSKTKIKDILAYDFLSELHISDDGNKLAYKKTNANYDNNKYESDLWIYDTNDNKNYPVTNQKNASIFTFNKDSNFIYKVKSEEDKDIFNIIDGPGVGKKAFEIKKDVSSIKWLKKDLFLVRASEKKSKEEKQKLEQTRITLDEVKRTLVADLRRINDEDYSQLDIEMELNKIEQKRNK